MDFFGNKTPESETNKNTPKALDTSIKDDVTIEQTYNPPFPANKAKQKKKTIRVPEEIYYNLFGLESVYDSDTLYDVLNHLINEKLPTLTPDESDRYERRKRVKINNDYI